MLISIHLWNTNQDLKSQLMKVQTWDPRTGQSTEHEQEMSFGGRESKRTKLIKDYIKDLYKKLSENIDETSELFHYDYFKLEGGNYTT